MPRFENIEDQNKYEELQEKLEHLELNHNASAYALLLDEEIDKYTQANPDDSFLNSPAYEAFSDHFATLYPGGSEEKLKFHRQVVDHVIRNAAIRQEDYFRRYIEIKSQLENGELEGAELLNVNDESLKKAASVITYLQTVPGRKYNNSVTAIDVVKRSVHLMRDGEHYVEVGAIINRDIYPKYLKVQNEAQDFLREKLEEYAPNSGSEYKALFEGAAGDIEDKSTLSQFKQGVYTVNFRNNDSLFLDVPKSKKTISSKTDKELDELERDLKRDKKLITDCEKVTSDYAVQAKQLAEELDKNTPEEKKQTDEYKKLHESLIKATTLGKATKMEIDGQELIYLGFVPKISALVMDEVIEAANGYSDPDFTKKVIDASNDAKKKNSDALSRGADKLYEKYSDEHGGQDLQSSIYDMDIKRISIEKNLRTMKMDVNSMEAIDLLKKNIKAINDKQDLIATYKQDAKMTGSGVKKFNDFIQKDLVSRDIKEKDRGKHKEYLDLTDSLKKVKEIDPNNMTPEEVLEVLKHAKQACDTYVKTHAGSGNLLSGWRQKGRQRIRVAIDMGELLAERIEKLSPQTEKLSEFIRGDDKIGDVYAELDWKKNGFRKNITEKRKSALKNGENIKFLNNTDEAIKRLESKEYTNQNELIQDAAYAYFGQSYRMIKSGAVQIKPDKSISLKEHMDKNINNPEFLNVLKNEDGSFKSPKQIAADVKDKNNMNRLVTESYKKVNPNADKNKDLNAQKANKAKTNSNVNNKKSVIKK